MSLRTPYRRQNSPAWKARARSAPKKKTPAVDIFEPIDSEANGRSDYAEGVIQSATSLLVLDAELRVKTANESFFKSFKISSRQAVNRSVFELSNGHWNIPLLRTLLEEVLPKKKLFKNFEVTHKFPGIG